MSRFTTAAAVATVAFAGAGVAFLALRAEAAPPADAPLVIYGEDGATPIYIEDPLDEYGIPIPVGPQHEASSVLVGGTIGPNSPPAPVFESELHDDGFGNMIPADSFDPYTPD